MTPFAPCSFFLFFFAFGAVIHCFPAENQSWYKPFFFEGAVGFCYVPEMFAGLAQPRPGFSGALGYEWQRLRFSLASGYTYVTGTNPMVHSLSYIPLTFRLGYAQPVWRNLSAKADIGFGFRFSQAALYKTALDRYRDAMDNVSATSPMGEGRLSLIFALPGNFMQLYAGANGFLVLDAQGPLPRSSFEAGLVFKPFAIVKSAVRYSVNGTPALELHEVIAPEPVLAAEETLPPTEEEQDQYDDHEIAPAIIERDRR